MRSLRESAPVSQSASANGIAVLQDSNRSFSRAQSNAEIDMLSGSCILAVIDNLHITDATEEATEILQTSIELNSIKVSEVHFKKVITEQENVQDVDERSDLKAVVDSEV